jgi:hypothetical protein
MAREPCLICEEETATGSPLYASRTVVMRDDARGFVCEDCKGRSSPERRRELSREQLARLHDGAAAFGAWWKSGQPPGTTLG